MKVVISGYIGKKITGIGRNLISLLDNSTSDVKFVIYTNADMKEDFKFTNPNVEVKTYKVSKNSSLKNLLWTTFVFPFVVRKEKADKALIPNFTLLLLKFRPTIVIMHDLIEFNIPDKFSKKKMFYRTKLADPITAKRANHIVTVSENSKKDIMKFLGVKESKISVVYNGVDRDKFRKINKKEADDIITKRGWPVDYLLYAGTIDHPGKNSMSVIQAFESLKSEGKYDGSLILAGMPGSGYDVVENYIKQSKYADDIVLTGFVSDEELVALYSNCKVFCFMSLYEGFGIPPLEALSCGAKVVTSNVSSLPEVVGQVGWSTEPHSVDMISDTIDDALKYELTEEDKKSVQEHLKRYDWNKLAEKFVNIIVN